ncbi:MAG TPA: type III pantothenate kinase [Rudaea sp.]|jgi:type III pantothenate kinase
MKLLIDLGNTRLKCALWDGTTLRTLGAATHAGPMDNVDFAALWSEAGAVSAILIASVAGAALGLRLARDLRRRFGLEPVFVASTAQACGVRNAYAQPERLGVDRFLGLIAVHADAAGAVVLASCGTALTLDAIDADGGHRGGLISASPALMIDALTGNTARLQRPRAARIVELAVDTADAIESGTWLGAAALIERFVERAAALIGSRPAVVLGGGGARRLGGLIAPAHRVDEEVVLRGLAIYADSVT